MSHLKARQPVSPTPSRPTTRSAVDLARRRVLLVGDTNGQLRAVIREADPAAEVVEVETNFDALAETGDTGSATAFDAVLASLDQFEQRPEAAVTALRQRLDDRDGVPGRLILVGGEERNAFGQRLLDLGGDDLLAMPADPESVRQALSAQPDRPGSSELPELPIITADALLSALAGRPGEGVAALLRQLNAQLPAGLALRVADEAEGEAGVAVPLRPGDRKRLLLSGIDAVAEGVGAWRAPLTLLAAQLARVADLDARHLRLQNLALTDDLTGCANKRYFRHFLDRILVKAKRERFPVTLLLFDIDNFKSYNDRYGHPVGDAILKDTAELIKRCVRDHDFVARIGGDEFAVVFWEKDAPATTTHPTSPQPPTEADADAGEERAEDEEGNARPELRRGGQFPKGPLQIAARFRRLMSSPEFTALGETGTGKLSISGGMSVFPYDGADAAALIAAADNALIFGAKRSGKNSITLVGGATDAGK